MTMAPTAPGPNGATNAVAVTTKPASGSSYSLWVPYKIGSGYGVGDAGVGAQFCSSGTVPLGGYTLSFDYYNELGGWVTAEA